MDAQQKQTVIQLAKDAEEKRKAENMNDADVIEWFVNQVKEHHVSLNNWFAIDDDIRKQHESEGWFWIIRRVRNNIQQYVSAKKLLEEDDNTFENGMDYVFNNYNETIKGLQDR